MRHFVLAFVVSLISVLNSFAGEADINAIYNEGIQYYSEGKYDLAREKWMQLSDSGYISVDLYYNIGNAAFKTGKIAESILFYEKALLKKPFDEDIRYNLEIANTFAVDNFEMIPELFISRWFRMVSLMVSSNLWAVISLILFLSALILVLLYLFSSRVLVKKTSFILAVITILLSLLSMGFSFQNRSITVFNRDAIIYSPAVTGKSSPDSSGKDLFIIHEGTRVKIEDQVGRWYEIRLSDGNVGWIPISSAEKI